MPSAHAARFLTAAADATRLRILAALQAAPKEELCVCELVDILRTPQYNVSKHLRVLAGAGLVGERRQGRWAYYRLPRELREVRALLRLARALDVDLDAPSRVRLRRRLALRRDGACVIGVRDSALLSRRSPRG